MTVSSLVRSREQMWSDLLVALGGSESYKTMSEEQMLAAIRNIYGGSVSALTTSESDLLASIVGAAGGSASVLTQSEERMLVALLSALGGSGSALTSSSEVLLAAIVFTRGGEGGSGSAPTPSATIDFVNGTYSASGSSQALEDVIGEDTETGATFDASDVIPGSGLRGLNNGGSTLPQFIGPLLADIVSDSAGVTILFELMAPTSPNGDALVGFDAFNSPTRDEDMALALGVDSGNFVFGAVLSSGLAGGSIPPDQDDLIPYASGLCKVAITGTPSSIAISVNGSDTVRFDLSPSFPWSDMTKAYIGDTFNADYLRSIKFYSPQNDATMKIMSVVTNTAPHDMVGNSWFGTASDGDIATTIPDAFWGAFPQPLVAPVAVDDELNTLTYTVTDADGLDLTMIDDVVAFSSQASPGVYQVTIRATDTGGLHCDQTFTITVEAP